MSDQSAALSKRTSIDHVMAQFQFRNILTLCAVQVLLLSIISLILQFVAIHRIDSVDNFLPTSLQVFSGPPQHPAPRPVIAYTVTLTGCGGGQDARYSRNEAMGLITQGAAVLRHSIYLAHESSKYDFRMYALVHPSAKECSEVMSKLGYTVLIRNTPFDRKDIKKVFLRENIDRASCCGEKEYIKLYAYTLVNHPVRAIILSCNAILFIIVVIP